MTAIFIIDVVIVLLIFAFWMLSVNDGPGKPFLIGWGIFTIVFFMWEYVCFGRIPIVGMGTELDNYGVLEILKLFVDGMYRAYLHIVMQVSAWFSK